MKIFLLLSMSVFFCNPAISNCGIFEEEAGFVLDDKNKTKEYVTSTDNSNAISAELVKIKNAYVSLYNSMHRSEFVHDKFKEQIEKFSSQSNADWIATLVDSSQQYQKYPLSIVESLRQQEKPLGAESLYCLGQVYEYGIGVDNNPAEAWAWYSAAFAIDGIFARKQQDRVWKVMDWEQQLEAQGLSERYIYEYTEIRNTPSTTIMN